MAERNAGEPGRNRGRRFGVHVSRGLSGFVAVLPCGGALCGGAWGCVGGSGSDSDRVDVESLQATSVYIIPFVEVLSPPTPSPAPSFVSLGRCFTSPSHARPTDICCDTLPDSRALHTRNGLDSVTDGADVSGVASPGPGKGHGKSLTLAAHAFAGACHLDDLCTIHGNSTTAVPPVRTSSVGWAGVI